MQDSVLFSNIERDASAAMHGDERAIEKLRSELHALHSDQLKSLAPVLEREFGKVAQPLLGGAEIDRDARGAVTSITFVPPVLDRLDGSHSVGTTLALNNFIDDAERLFDRLDTNKNGSITWDELAKASADPKFAGIDASTITALTCLMELDSQYKKLSVGLTRNELEGLRKGWATEGQSLGLYEVNSEVSNTGNRKLFPNKISADDIHQGRIGDCEFEAVAAAVAAKMPERIQNMIKDNHNGTYTVTVNQHDIVTVTAPTPTEQRLGDQSAALWPVILEKAYSEWSRQNSRSSANLHLLQIANGANSRLALLFLTGRLPETLDHAGPNEQAWSAFLQASVSRGAPAVAGTTDYKNGKTIDGFPGGHEYTILSFDPTGSNGGTVTMRNPWGVEKNTPNGEWKISLDQFYRNFSDMATVDIDGPVFY